MEHVGARLPTPRRIIATGSGRAPTFEVVLNGKLDPEGHDRSLIPAPQPIVRVGSPCGASERADRKDAHVTIRNYLRLLLKHRYLILGGLVIGLAAGVFSVATAETTNRGKVSFFISSSGEGTVQAANVGDQFALRRVNSYLALLGTDRLAQMILDETGLDSSPASVRRLISGSADLNTVLLTARVDHPDRERAEVITDSLSRQFPDLVADVERPTVGEPTVRLELVSGPAVSEVPIQTRWILATRIAAGLLIALALALLRELTDNRIQSIDRALTLAKAPLLGLVTFDRSASKSPLILGDGVGSMRAEQYRQVRTSLQFVDPDHRAKVVVVTSSIPSEGKSVTAANLAVSMARSGQRVVIVDADLRRPTAARLFGVPQEVGVVEVLRGQVSVYDVLQPWGDMDLTVLAAGGHTSNPSELLGTVAMARLVSTLRSEYDAVIIDTPPLLPVTDASIVATLVDGVVLMVRPDKVTRAQLERSLGNLERVHANLLGIVGTMLPERSSPYNGAYYHSSEAPPDEDADGGGAVEVVPPAPVADRRSPFLLEDALRTSRRSRSAPR